MSDIQSVIFQKAYWTPAKSRKWLKEHGFAPMKKMHETIHYYRYRLENPKKFSRFAIKNVPKDKLKFVIGFYH